MKLQVLMCAYNEKPYIQQAIESVLAQKTNFEFQLLIGEDYSTDGTREIVQSFAERYSSKIKVFLNHKNLGFVKNFKNIYDNSTAEYLAILDGDDFWIDPLKLQKQVDFMDKNPDISFSFHNAKILNSQNGQELLFLDPNNMQQQYSLENILVGNHIPWCTVIYRKYIPFIPEWFEKVSVLDWALHVLYAEKGNYALINEIMGCYRLRERSIWGSKPEPWRIKKMISTANIINKSLNYKYTDNLSRTILHYYKQLIDISINKNDFTDALDNVYEALNDISDISLHEQYLLRYLQVFLRSVLKMIETNNIKGAVASYKKGFDVIPFVKELHSLDTAITTLATKQRCNRQPTDISNNKNVYSEALDIIFESLHEVSDISLHEPYLSKYLKVFFESILEMIDNNNIECAIISYKKGFEKIPFVKELQSLDKAITRLEAQIQKNMVNEWNLFVKNHPYYRKLQTSYPLDRLHLDPHSYGEINALFYSKNAHLTIGKCCSIAEDVHFLIGGRHFSKTFSTYPFSVFYNEKIKTDINNKDYYFNNIQEDIEKNSIIVCDDVWIGFGATIMPGVTLNQGCIVGTCAVVVSSPPPYSIVVGCPAKVIKYRFDDDIISEILKFADYSKLTDEKVEKYYDFFMTTELTKDNIDEFRRIFEE